MVITCYNYHKPTYSTCNRRSWEKSNFGGKNCLPIPNSWQSPGLVYQVNLRVVAFQLCSWLISWYLSPTSCRSSFIPFIHYLRNFPWFSHHFLIICPWFFHDFPWFSHHFPTIFPWFSHDFDMIFIIFLLFSHHFPMIFQGHSTNDSASRWSRQGTVFPARMPPFSSTYLGHGRRHPLFFFFWGMSTRLLQLWPGVSLGDFHGAIIPICGVTSLLETFQGHNFRKGVQANLRRMVQWTNS